MTVGTPVTIEMAVMFLYGKKPKLTEENIESMIDLAEFLLIPNLKSACISWLKTVTITDENCIKVIELSSIYDFEIPRCDEYLTSHLTEMLQHVDTVNLSKDSVQYLFLDRKLSYVSMDDKVKSLIRWSNSHTSVNERDMGERFGLIDFHDVSMAVHEELRTYGSINKTVDFEKCLSNIANNIPSLRHRVLIRKGENHDRSFWCLELEREKWFQLKPENNQRERPYFYYQYCEILGAKDVGSEIFFKQNSYQDVTLAMLSLEEDVCRTYNLVREGDGNSLRDIKGFRLSADTCFAYLNERVKTNSQAKLECEARDLQNRLRLFSESCDSIHQFVAKTMMLQKRIISNKYADTSTLFTGHMNDEAKNIKLSPVLTFKKEISKICIHKMLTVAILHGSNGEVSFYDLNDFKMETMQLETKYDDKLAETNEGFIIYNEHRCICLTRIIGLSLSLKFTSKQVSLKIEGLCDSKMIFCGNMWYHYYRENEHYILESASHSELTLNASVKGVTWRRLPLPLEESRCYGSTIGHNLFQISLPKSKLRCDIECPHCHLRSESRYRRAVSSGCEVGDTYYDGSSDDDYY